ncbi:T9SS type B sorting domain-containing protein [Lacinutrix salivirga]
MKKILFLLCLLLGLISYSQQEAANWYFGDNAGIQFDNATGTVTALTDGQLFTEEGCTSISNNTGELLFYTNGEIVYDRFGDIMPNGTGLLGNQSSTQSAIIVPKPNDDNIYYIFTADTPFQSTTDSGFGFSEVDMTLNGGLGDVTTKNQILLFNASEKLSAVLKDCESQNIWVITFADSNGGESNNTFYAYEVSAAGVNTTPVVSFAGITVNERRGYLKFSPDGTKLACANVAQGLYLFDFDTATGTVSNPQNIFITFRHEPTKPQSSYGIEFSPNNELLYVSSYYETPQDQFNIASAQYGALLQYDLNATDIGASETVLDDRQLYRSALQLGPNGKIYRTLSATYNNGIPFLSVINNPNNLGLAANYNHATIDLAGRNARQGLPPFIASFFSEKIDIIPTDTTNTIDLPLCEGENYTLIAEDIPGGIYTWTKDGVAIPTPTIPNELLVTENGNYEVLIDLNTGDCETKEGQAIVTYFDIPIANPINDISVCDNNNDGISTFDFTTLNNEILLAQNPLDFEVKYFSTQQDADNNENELVFPYNNISSIQTIIARIQNFGNANCYDTTAFTLRVFNTPTVEASIDFEVCDDTSDGDNTNGQTTITLSDFNSDILGAQNASAYTITYHENQNDANTSNAPLPNNYYNQTPGIETLFVRIENNLNTSCFATASFDLIINPAPVAINTSLFQCDEDGISDGFTTFNLTEANTALTNGATGVTTQFFTTFNNAESNSNALNSNNYQNASNPQILYVRVNDAATECYNIAELSLEVSTTQINPFTPQPVCDELGSEDGINTFNLEDFTSSILAALPAGLDINYYESYENALLEQNALISPYNNTTPYSQTLYVRVENDNACFGISDFQLTINPLPQLEDDETILYCLNNFPELVTLNGGVINDSPNNYTYSWSSGENTIEIEVNEIGTYTATVTTTAGCSKQRTINIEASNIATITDIEVTDGSLNNNTVTVLATGEGSYQYELINAEGITTGYQTNTVFTNVAPGIYTANVKDTKNNCGVVDQMVSVIGFPLYFTPNNDGENDYWQVYGVSRQFQPNSKILIYDRYGKLLAQVSPSGLGWDGKLNGNLLPASDYWFSVTLQDGRVYMNHFTLKR